MEKGKDSNTKAKKFILAAVFVLMLVFSFFYKHYFAYRLASYHLEYESSYPLLIGLASLITLFVLGIISVKKKKVRFFFYLALIVFIGSVLCFIGGRHTSCPACSDPDPIYKLMYKLFTGQEYLSV